MKTIKKLSFAVATFVALSFSLSSCDAISEALSKEVEVTAPPIDFSIGGTTPAPMQKVNGVAEVIWLDKTVDISTKLKDELAKNNLTLDKVKALKVTGSTIEVITAIIATADLGNLKIYIDGNLVATGSGAVSPTDHTIDFTYTAPYDMFAKLGAGTVQVKITSDKAKPLILYNMQLINKYLGKVGLL